MEMGRMAAQGWWGHLDPLGQRARRVPLDPLGEQGRPVLWGGLGLVEPGEWLDERAPMEQWG